MANDRQIGRPGFCIYADTTWYGPVPVQRSEKGFPVVYTTLFEAQREIANDVLERLRQFLADERDFDDATTVEEYIVEVVQYADGSICDEAGNCFGRLP